MNSNEQLIHQFYTSFARLDVAGMQSCYHKQVHFSDPAFPDLWGEEAGAMWVMLTDALKKNPTGWKLEYNDVVAGEEEGSCTWEAHYTFSPTGRKVHNIISAKFRFRDGKIIDHADTFDFYRWAKMALGTTGLLMGWTGYFRKALQRKTKQRLQQFIQRNQR